MKINVDLQPTVNTGSGIAVFANELIEQLKKQKEFLLKGCFHYIRKIPQKCMRDYGFPYKYSYIPYKLLYSRSIPHMLPIYYDWITGMKADINLSFTYRIPRVVYRGIVVSTIHDLIPLKTVVENDSIKQNYINDIKYTAKHSDYLLTVSESSKKDIVDFLNFPKEKIYVVYDGVDFCRFNTPVLEELKRKVRIKYKLPEHFILYMGGIRKHKNIENLILAYANLPKEDRKSYPLVITKGADSLRQLVSDLQLDETVMFTTFIDEEDKVAVYQMADVFTFISSYEGFGIPIIEAQAAGTPVLASNTSSIPEAAGEGALFCTPSNILEITDSLHRLIFDSTLRQQLKVKGFENAKKYSWKESGNKLITILNDICNNV